MSLFLLCMKLVLLFPLQYNKADISFKFVPSIATAPSVVSHLPHYLQNLPHTLAHIKIVIVCLLFQQFCM